MVGSLVEEGIRQPSGAGIRLREDIHLGVVVEEGMILDALQKVDQNDRCVV